MKCVTVGHYAPTALIRHRLAVMVSLLSHWIYRTFLVAAVLWCYGFQNCVCTIAHLPSPSYLRKTQSLVAGKYRSEEMVILLLKYQTQPPSLLWWYAVRTIARLPSPMDLRKNQQVSFLEPLSGGDVSRVYRIKRKKMRIARQQYLTWKKTKPFLIRKPFLISTNPMATIGWNLRAKKKRNHIEFQYLETQDIDLMKPKFGLWSVLHAEIKYQQLIWLYFWIQNPRLMNLDFPSIWLNGFKKKSISRFADKKNHSLCSERRSAGVIPSALRDVHVEIENGGKQFFYDHYFWAPIKINWGPIGAALCCCESSRRNKLHAPAKHKKICTHFSHVNQILH